MNGDGDDEEILRLRRRLSESCSSYTRRSPSEGVVCELCDSFKSQCTLSPKLGDPSRDSAVLDDPEQEDSSLSTSPTACTPEVDDDDDDDVAVDKEEISSFDDTDGLDTAFNNFAASFNCFIVPGGTLVPS